jgi:hypothetical protein
MLVPSMEQWQRWPVSKIVGNVKNDVPEWIDPITLQSRLISRGADAGFEAKPEFVSIQLFGIIHAIGITGEMAALVVRRLNWRHQRSGNGQAAHEAEGRVLPRG